MVCEYYILWNPLHLASENDNLSIVEYLVNQKADINATSIHYKLFYMVLLPFILPQKMVN